MFKVTMNTDNDAFQGDSPSLNHEVARILRDIAKKLEQGATGGNCRDSNGNTVGTWSLK